MGLFSDTLEDNRERVNIGYIDPCMIMSSSLCNNKRFNDYRAELYNLNDTQSDIVLNEKLRDEFWERYSELEKLKASYLIAEKAVLEIINRGKRSLSR